MFFLSMAILDIHCSLGYSKKYCENSDHINHCDAVNKTLTAVAYMRDCCIKFNAEKEMGIRVNIGNQQAPKTRLQC